jgi:drug/metabolite transporter (DMT)-like permease
MSHPIPRRIALTAALLALGLGWGATQPLSKIAVSEGYRPLGLIFWQVAIGAVVLGAVSLARGRGLPVGPAHLRTYAVIAALGTLLPNTISYAAAVHLPAGWLSVVIAAVPMMTFALALPYGLDRFEWGRLGGLALGLAGVACLAATNDGAAGGLGASAVLWLLLLLLSPMLYSGENLYVARVGLAGLDPLQALFGASVLSALVAGPAALLTGSFIDLRPPWGAPDAALFLLAVIHAACYTGYVALIGRAGPVFAAQTGYLVTVFGVLWAMAVLGERYGAGFWVALALMLAGVFLVQPRQRAAA